MKYIVALLGSFCIGMVVIFCIIAMPSLPKTKYMVRQYSGGVVVNSWKCSSVEFDRSVWRLREDSTNKRFQVSGNLLCEVVEE